MSEIIKDFNKLKKCLYTTKIQRKSSFNPILPETNFCTDSKNYTLGNGYFKALSFEQPQNYFSIIHFSA